MRRRSLSRAIVIGLVGAVLLYGDPDPSAGADFYLSTSGNDSWSGELAEPNVDGTDGPWRSLSKTRMLSKKNTLRPGDRVLLKRGDLWNELDLKWMMWLEGLTGTAENPITIGAYGAGERPVLSGVGLDRGHAIIRAQHLHHVTIQDLHLVGGANTGEFLWLRADTHESGTSHVRVLRTAFDNTLEDQREGGTGILYVQPSRQPGHVCTRPAALEAPPPHRGGLVVLQQESAECREPCSTRSTPSMSLRRRVGTSGSTTTSSITATRRLTLPARAGTWSELKQDHRTVQVARSQTPLGIEPIEQDGGRPEQPHRRRSRLGDRGSSPRRGVKILNSTVRRSLPDRGGAAYTR